jgi:hypothetical protein
MSYNWIKKPRLYAPPEYEEYRVRIVTTSFTHNRPTMTASMVELYNQDECVHTVMCRPALYGNRPSYIASYIEGVKCFNFFRKNLIAPPTKRIVFEIGDIASFLGWSRQRSLCSIAERLVRRKAMFVPNKLKAQNPELEIYILLADPSYLHDLENYVENCRARMKVVPYFEDIYGKEAYCESVRLKRTMLRLWRKTFTSQD